MRILEWFSFPKMFLAVPYDMDACMEGPQQLLEYITREQSQFLSKLIVSLVACY